MQPTRSPALGWMLISTLVLAGCATVSRPPSADQTQAVRSGKGALVLLRLEGIIDEKPMSGLKGYTASGAATARTLFLRIADLETCAPPSAVMPAVSPSPESAAQGWLYLELTAGSYWLSLVLPGAISDSTADFQVSSIPPWTGQYGHIERGEFAPLPSFRLEVRGDEPVIYAGTLRFACGPDRAPTILVADETGAARQLAQRAFGGAGFSSLSTRLLEPYGQAVPPENIHQLGPVGIAAADQSTLGEPDWMKRSMKLWLAPSGVLLAGAAQAGDPYGAAGLAMLGLAYAPFGAIGGLIQGHSQKSRWHGCVEELTQELHSLRPSGLLVSRLQEACAEHLRQVPVQVDAGRATWRVAPPDGLRGILLANVTRVQLREGYQGGTFCVEVGMRMRLWNTAEQRWVYDRSFVYTEFNPKHRTPLERPYETVLLASSPALRMSEYCGPAGRDLFRKEIRRALDLVISEVRSDLGLEPRLISR